MRHRPPRVPLVLAFVLLGGAVATPARAVPVRYTFEGTVALSSGSDSLGIDGAFLRVVAVADTSDAPASTALGSEHPLERFHEGRGNLHKGGRPQGANFRR